MSNRSSVSQNAMKFQCNRCLTHLKLFDAAQSTGGRVAKHYWTTCNHVLCQKCRMRHTDKCAACDQTCRFMEINNKMPEHFKLFFEPAQNMCQVVNRVAKFQRTQDDLVISQKGQRMDRKYRDAKPIYNEAKENYQKSVAQKSNAEILRKKCREEKKRRQNEQNRIGEERERQRRMYNSQGGQRRRRTDRGNEWSQFHGQAQHLQANQPNYGLTPRFRIPSDFGDTTRAPVVDTPQTTNPNPFF